MDFEIAFNKPHITPDYTLSPSELHAFYADLKNIIWVLLVRSETGLDTYGAAFSIDQNGLVITSAHIFHGLAPYITYARKLHENFQHQAEVVDIRPQWDLALLRVKNISDCSFGKLAVDGTLFEGQDVLHIGHPYGLVGSFSVGKVVFQCLDNVILPTGNETCNDYQPTSLQITPEYRVMGDIVNSAHFKIVDPASHLFTKQLNPLVPVIQIFGLITGSGGSGGPLFNSKGEIVGITSMGIEGEGFAIGIHVSVLKLFLKEIKEQSESTKGSRFPDPSKKAGSSKKRKA